MKGIVMEDLKPYENIMPSKYWSCFYMPSEIVGTKALEKLYFNKDVKKSPSTLTHL